jgi:adenylosuccinate lyase
MATENLMMAAVQSGGDRQEVHEIVRKHSHAVTRRIKDGAGSSTELLELLKAEPSFARVDFETLLDPRMFVGRAPEQVEEFLAEYVEPIRKRYASALGMKAELNV